MKIASVVGTRPQFIKASALSRVFKKLSVIEEYIIHTGQHYDTNMSDIFFSELELPEPAINLGVNSNLPGKQTGRILESIEEVLSYEKPDWVLVYGDNNSALAGALAAAKLNIPVAHVEAGLRSFNRKFPEEINRVAIDHICDILFAPTQNAMDNLVMEGLAEKCVFTGDVMYDSVLHYKTHLAENVKLSNIADVEAEKYYVATIHRPENTDNLFKLQNIFMALSELDYPVIVPLHPRSVKFVEEITYRSNVQIIAPVGYTEMMTLLLHCLKVITDSGGVQKEAYFFKKPCITLRNETEWIETLEGNWNSLVGSNKIELVERICETRYGMHKNSFGEGDAAERIVNYLLFGNSGLENTGLKMHYYRG